MWCWFFEGICLHIQKGYLQTKKYSTSNQQQTNGKFLYYFLELFEKLGNLWNVSGKTAKWLITKYGFKNNTNFEFTGKNRVHNASFTGLGCYMKTNVKLSLYQQMSKRNHWQREQRFYMIIHQKLLIHILFIRKKVWKNEVTYIII